MTINGQNLQNSTSTLSEPTLNPDAKAVSSLKELKKTSKPKWRGFLIILLILLLLVGTLGGGTYYYLNYYNKTSTPNLLSNLNPYTEPTVLTPTPTPEPIFYPNPITGELIPEARYNEIKDRPFLAVMIQNNTASRPEYGLNEADLVYESLVEGRITRFMGIFWSNDVEKIQSIRSARRYYIDLLGDYNNPAYMHIGYSSSTDNKVDSIYAFNTYKIRRLSDLRDKETSNLSYSRDVNCEKVRAREHCAFTDTTRLWKIADQQNWKNDLSTFTNWKFQDVDESALLNGQDLAEFTVHFRPSPGSKTYYDGNYSVKWKYEPITKKYQRFNLDGTPYLDGNGRQVVTNTVIYQKVVSTPTGDAKGHQYQEVIGSGTGYIMEQGKVFKVNWSKPNYKTRTKFTDSTSNQEFVFQKGKIWVMLMPKSYDYE